MIGPPELFSRYSCIFLVKGSEKWDATWVSERVDRLIKFREKMVAQDGMEPHPSVLLQEFWDKHGDD